MLSCHQYNSETFQILINKNISFESWCFRLRNQVQVLLFDHLLKSIINSDIFQRLFHKNKISVEMPSTYIEMDEQKIHRGGAATGYFSLSVKW